MRQVVDVRHWKWCAGALAVGMLALVLMPATARAQEQRTSLRRSAPAVVELAATELRLPVPAGAPLPRTDLPPTMPREEVAGGRNDAMLNGALVALGTLGIADNVVVHWILGWHRAIEDSPYALHLEIGTVVVSGAMLAVGIVRERRARASAPPE